MKNFLIDTHILIWFLTDHPNLSPRTKKLIEESESCFISVASIWEIGIKVSLGKLELQISISKLIELVQISGFYILPIDQFHVLKNSELIFFHRDPFDRILISQALVENLEIITADSEFLKYPSKTIIN
ncbi:type II toxin-antitoxin system VapC family toxin [Algoriphagus confluentis]|uniref:Type II toxin-antitoxin system VapC family toxin n=1 Tax=Algoriphagus confluentis TaxID=1697556 RepID=A0ABQ6PUW8_9BACT|nr:type II toxin-antitoxin system VapC family toxin [Algoriphagus confluentis]